MATVEQFISACAAEIGNRGWKYNMWKWGYDGVAWCATGLSWVNMVALDGTLGFDSGAVSAIRAQLQPEVAVETTAGVRRGDLACYNWDGRTDRGWMDHIEAVEWVGSDGTFGTIGFNTDNIVKRVTRTVYASYFVCFVRPTFSDAPVPEPPQPEPGGIPESIKYRAMVDGTWFSELADHYDTGGSGDDFAGALGRPIQYLAMGFPGWYQVCTQANGWLPRVSSYNVGDLEYGAAGDGSPITGVRAYYETADPNATGWYGIRYQVHDPVNGWLSELVDLDDTGGSGDDFAGAGVAIDGFRARLTKL